MDKDIKEILEILIHRVLKYEHCTGNFDIFSCENCNDSFDCGLAHKLLTKLESK